MKTAINSLAKTTKTAVATLLLVEFWPLVIFFLTQTLVPSFAQVTNSNCLRFAVPRRLAPLEPSWMALCQLSFLMNIQIDYYHRPGLFKSDVSRNTAQCHLSCFIGPHRWQRAELWNTHKLAYFLNKSSTLHILSYCSYTQYAIINFLSRIICSKFFLQI